MNLSKAVSHLKMQLGLHSITLPFKDGITGEPQPVENVIMEVLQTVTIPTYSQYKPWEKKTNCNLNSLTLIDRKSSLYLLPPVLTMTPIIDVMSVKPSLITNIYGSRGYSDPMYTMGGSMQSIITSQAYMTLIGQARAEPTWDYIGENKIHLYYYPRMMLEFRVSCEHEPNGETIKDSCYDSFMQLAKLDMQEFLYNNLKLYDNISTAFGNIQLKVEDFQGAAQERNSLLKEWETVFHLDMDWEQFM